MVLPGHVAYNREVEEILRGLLPGITAEARKIHSWDARQSTERSSGVQEDDLVQAGLIQAWENIVEGRPHGYRVVYAMRDQMRREQRQRQGQVPYEGSLPA